MWIKRTNISNYVVGKGIFWLKTEFCLPCFGLCSTSNHNSMPLSSAAHRVFQTVMRYTQALQFSKCNSRKQNGPTALMKVGHGANLVENSFCFPNYAWPSELLKISESGLESPKRFIALLKLQMEPIIYWHLKKKQQSGKH